MVTPHRQSLGRYYTRVGELFLDDLSRWVDGKALVNDATLPAIRTGLMPLNNQENSDARRHTASAEIDPGQCSAAEWKRASTAPPAIGWWTGSACRT
jgi:hypothetical protein